MVSVSFGKKWAIIKESQKVFGIEMDALLSSTQNTRNSRNNWMMANYMMGDSDQKDRNIKEISFTLPSSKSEVLDIQFL